MWVWQRNKDQENNGNWWRAKRTQSKTDRLKTVMGNATCEKSYTSPALLYVERAGFVHLDTHESSLKSLNDPEYELTMSDSSYHLVAVILGNSTHWCDITLIHGKYLHIISTTACLKENACTRFQDHLSFQASDQAFSRLATVLRRSAGHPHARYDVKIIWVFKSRIRRF